MMAATPRIELVPFDAELKRLWDEEQGKDKIRACLFNLIIYSQKSERGPFCKEIIHSVISKFPCRIILITTDEKPQEDFLKTSVFTETIQAGSAQIFCEILHIEVGGKPVERVPFIVLPLILPDLPVYLLWSQDPTTENTVLPPLSSFARRIIFDSEAAKDLQAFSQSVLALQNRFSIEVGDLNWSALRGWRKLFATTFNHPEELLSLTLSKTIQIHYNAVSSSFSKHPEIEAAYFQAWLASQLDWKFERMVYEEGRMFLTYKKPQGDVSIYLIPQEEDTLPPGALLSIEIDSLHLKTHMVFKRHPATSQVFMQFSNQDHCELPHVTFLSGASQGQEIVEEIFYKQDSQHYRDMLHTLSGIAWRKNP